jgi:hypothetical protein
MTTMLRTGASAWPQRASKAGDRGMRSPAAIAGAYPAFLNDSTTPAARGLVSRPAPILPGPDDGVA